MDFTGVWTPSPYEMLGIVIAIMIAMKILAPYIDVLTFGRFKIQTAKSLVKEATADNILKDNIDRMINTIDYEARKRMRAALISITHNAMVQFPDQRETVLVTRTPLSTAICDNHITRDLAEESTCYAHRKLQECFEFHGKMLEANAKAAISWVVIHWLRETMGIQLRAVEDKLRTYREARGHFHNQGLESGLSIRIEKNMLYEKIITELQSDKVDPTTSVVINDGIKRSYDLLGEDTVKILTDRAQPRRIRHE